MPGKIDIRNTDFDFLGDGIAGTAVQSTTTSFDFKITEDNCHVNGGEVLNNGAEFGDYIKVEVIDIDNVIGYGPNVVLQVYLKKWYVLPNGSTTLDIPYAGKVPKNLYLRLKYTSTSTTTDVKVAANYFLHLEKA